MAAIEFISLAANFAFRSGRVQYSCKSPIDLPLISIE